MYGVDWAEVYQGEVYIHERLTPLPRAYVAYASEYVPDDGRAVERLLDESFDLRNVVMTAEPVDLPARPLVPAHAAEIVSYQNTQVVIRARAIQRGLLLLGDRFYPGWKAYVDGRPVPILRVNLLFRGVVLPPGEHEIAFRFAPASLRRGGWISLASIVCLLLVVGVAGWKVKG